MTFLDPVKQLFQQETDELTDYRRVLLPTTRDDLIVTGADGCRLDLIYNGSQLNDVIDATSQVGTNPLGHRYEPLVEDLRSLYREDSDFPLMVAGNDSFHPLQRQLAEAFTDIYPGDMATGDLKVYYCNSGSEAVERGCLKAAQLYSGGNTFVNVEGAFHGRTALALSHTNSKQEQTAGYSFLQRTVTAPFASTSGGAFHDDAETNAKKALSVTRRRIDREGPENIVSIMTESLQGEGGYNVPHAMYMQGLRDIADEYSLPFIVDEVQASLRTGEWFGIEHFDVQPDMIPVAKAFSGGISPFGASLIQEEFATDREGKHSSTFGGNPKECLIALKTIQYIRDNDLLTNAAEQGSYLAERFATLEQFEHVHESRGIGLFRGIEFRVDGTPAPELRDKVIHRLLTEHGVWTEPCGNDRYNAAMRFLLPVNVSDRICVDLADAVEEVVRATEPS